MTRPDECLEEYVHLTDEECNIAVENREDIKNKGASCIIISNNDSDMDPNRVRIWGPTEESVKKAAEYYDKLKNLEIDNS